MSTPTPSMMPQTRKVTPVARGRVVKYAAGTYEYRNLRPSRNTRRWGVYGRRQYETPGTTRKVLLERCKDAYDAEQMLAKMMEYADFSQLEIRELK